jgi:hypothetical protein
MRAMSGAMALRSQTTWGGEMVLRRREAFEKEERAMPNREQNPNDKSQHEKTRTMDAVRHVGPTLEAEGVFLPTGELPENRIENEALTDTVNVRAATEDAYDREAEAMGAEPLKTRLPGDRSSDPHTDLGPDNATALDDERESGAGGKRGRAA